MYMYSEQEFGKSLWTKPPVKWRVDVLMML